MIEAFAWVLWWTFWLAMELAAMVLAVVMYLAELLAALLRFLWRLAVVMVREAFAWRRSARTLAVERYPTPRRARPRTTAPPVPPRELKR